MGLLTKSLGIRAYSMEDPAQPLLPFSALMESLGMGKSDAGVMVNEKQAMRIPTAQACINVISSDVSSLSFGIFQTLPDGSVREAKDHRLYSLFHDEPNEKMTSQSFRGALLAQVLGWGNAYALIRRDRAARAVSLDMLPSDRTCPAVIKGKDERGELVYVTTATSDGMPQQIDPKNVLHIPGLTLDGIVGISPIQTCKNAFGLSLAAEKFGAQFFGNGARATGVLTHPGQLDAEAYENIKKSVREQMTGESALRPLLLEEGMQWAQMTIAPNDAQFLETRQFQRTEIAALFRVAMHLLQDLTRSTNNNIEHQSLDHIRYTLRPWAIRIEQEFNRKLLSAPFHCAHDFNDFQRGDFASQTTGWTLLRNAGVYSANDILRAMHQNPIPSDEGGDVRLAPMNMVPLDTLAAENRVDPTLPADDTTDSDEGTPITDRFQMPIVNAYRRLFRDAVGRIVNRKEKDSRFAYKALKPIVDSMAEAIYTMQFPGKFEPTHEESEFLSSYAVGLSGPSGTCANWTKENASETATRITGEAYAAIKSKLIGE
jgi:HK97 family phage portal protein